MAADIATRLQALCDTFTADLVQSTADAKAATATAVSALETRLVALDHAVNMIREAEQRTYSTVLDAKDATVALSADVDRQLQTLRHSWTNDLVQSATAAASEVEGRFKTIDGALMAAQQAQERVEVGLEASNAALSEDIEKSIALLRTELTRSSVASAARLDERLQAIDDAIAAAQQSTKNTQASSSATMADVDARLETLDKALTTATIAHQQAAADATASTAALAAYIESRVAALRAAWTSELATSTDASAAAVDGRLAAIDAAVVELRETQHQTETRTVATAATFAADVETRLQTLRVLLTAETAASALEVEGRFNAVDGILAAQQQADINTKTSVAALADELDRRLKAIDDVIAAVQESQSTDYAKVPRTHSHPCRICICIYNNAPFSS